METEYQTAEHRRRNGPSGNHGQLQEILKRECDNINIIIVVGPKIERKRLYRVHLDFALGFEQQPPDGHAHEIRPKSRPRFVVDLVEQRQRVVNAVVGKRILFCHFF